MKIRDEQQPDRTGKTLPLDLSQGQFHWSMVASPGDTHILARAEVKSRTERVASSYSCFVCCQDSGPYGGFDPHAYGLFIDGFAAVGTNGGYVDCYNNFYSSGVWFSSMWTWNSSIATLDSSELHGEGTGSTNLDGIYDRMEWWSDGMDCYPFWSQPGDNAPVDVSPHIDSISPAASAVGHPVTVTLSGQGFAQGATIEAGAGVNVSEITVSSATSMSAIFSVNANATAGDRNVTVTVNGQTSNSKTFTVQVPDRLRVVSDTGNVSLANCPSVQGRLITYQVTDSTAAHLPIAQAIFVVEALDNLTTNTCGNGQPNPSSCEPTNDSGQFTDGISVNPSCGGGALSNCSSNPSCGYEYTQRWSTCFPETVVELMSAPGITHCNQIKINNSTQLGSGTLMPK